MTTPIRSVPGAVERWSTRLRWLRWADAFAGWLVLLAGLSLAVPRLPAQAVMTLAAGLLGAGVLLPWGRRTWRPVSALILLRASRGLSPGDHAWLVLESDTHRVLVTARHGLRVVVARPGHDAVEGMSVRRTRVLLLPGSPRVSG